MVVKQLFLARALSFVAIGESAFVLDCMFVSPQNSDVETLTTNVMRWHLERGVFGRKFGYEGRALLMGWCP